MATQTAKPTTKSTPVVTPASSSRATRSGAERVWDRSVAWVNAHRQLSSWIGTILVVAAGLFAWHLSTSRREEEIASRELQGARFAFENQNMPLAASELAKVIANYEGTSAADEAHVLLANVRLQQGQPQQAVNALQDWASGAGQAYRGQAYALLGAAYENMARFKEAAGAYEKASSASRLDFEKAQALSDAGRAWTSAADTAKAIAAYRRIVKDFPKESTVTEAKVRLAELTKGSVS